MHIQHISDKYYKVISDIQSDEPLNYLVFYLADQPLTADIWGDVMYNVTHICNRYRMNFWKWRNDSNTLMLIEDLFPGGRHFYKKVVHDNNEIAGIYLNDNLIHNFIVYALKEQNANIYNNMIDAVQQRNVRQYGPRRRFTPTLIQPKNDWIRFFCILGSIIIKSVRQSIYPAIILSLFYAAYNQL